ncbi:MAG: 3-hydroxybutyrate dehydrogenase [Alphaproteobacteria bacterium]|nr:3-hydroxybutyrate dehydrogenase [Alphaproteobacteria bacterium]
MDQKTVLITGSTRGIGLGIAKRFAAEGYAVALNSFEPEDQVGDVLAGFDGAAHYFGADLARPAAGAELVARVIERFGGLDVLINNAGVQNVAPVDEFERKDWDRVLAVGLNGTFDTITVAIAHMKQRGRGRIINIASVHGLRASAFKSAYVAAKHGVVGLTKSVALEVAEAGITVNAICPGYVHTEMVERQLADQARIHNLPVAAVKRDIMLSQQPTRQFVTVEEVAELAFYLAGDMARSITGAAIAIDGGWMAK